MKNSILILLASRKGLLSFIVLVMTTVLAVGITIAAVKKELAWKEAFDYLLKTVFTAVTAIIVNIWGIATEDSAKKGNSNNGSENNSL